MVTDPNHVIAEAGECACHSVHIVHIHHRNFPEIRAECGTAAEGAAHLCNLLARELEGSGDNWQGELLRQALADVRAYVEALGHNDEGRSVEERRPVQPDLTTTASPPGQVAGTCLRTSAAPDYATARAAGRTPLR